MKILALALASASFVASAADAQMTAPASTPAAAPAPAASAPPIVAGQPDNVLRTGTQVPLRLTEALTTEHKALRVGQHFNLETTEPLSVANHIVIPAGTPAVGSITEVKNKGMWGKSGKFTAQLLYITYGGRQIRLTGTFDDKGHSGGVAAGAVSALVFLPAGFFMTGHSAQMPVGAPVTGFVGEDISVAFAETPAPVMVVPVSAPAPTQPAMPASH